jgi:hypothetical protein
MLARGRAIDTINARCGLIRRFVEFTNGYVRRLKTRATLAVNLIEQRVGHAQWLPAVAARSRSNPTLLVHFDRSIRTALNVSNTLRHRIFEAGLTTITKISRWPSLHLS